MLGKKVLKCVGFFLSVVTVVEALMHTHIRSIYHVTFVRLEQKSTVRYI